MIRKFILCTFLIASVFVNIQSQNAPLIPSPAVFPIAPTPLPAPSLCTCPALPTDIVSSINNSPLIFTGRVANIVASSNRLNNRIYFFVNTLFRGRTRSNRIIINSPNTNANCGYPFVIGNDYLVYTSYDANRNLMINQCSRTNALANSCNDLVTLSSYLLPAVPAPIVPLAPAANSS